ERLGNSELGDDPEPSGGQRAAEKIPEDRLGPLATPRAACTAFATSSTSPSASVRQSRSRRPSRTMPITAGSPDRKRPPSSPWTADAKLASAAGGGAPAPP